MNAPTTSGRRPWRALPLVLSSGLLLSLLAGPRAAAAPPRTLVVVLDGLPFRVVERARNLGAFAGWPPASRMIAPFPSMTNVSLTLLLGPLGVDPVPGYELQHYDWAANEISGGGAFEHREGPMPWRRRVDVANRTLPQKLGTYARPVKHFDIDLRRAEELVMTSEQELVLAHLGATDALQHLRGDEATLPLLLELDERLRSLRARHLEERGSELRVVLLSDHGNSNRKIRRLFGARKLLEAEGLRVSKRLKRPEDVVVGTFGVTGYAALYMRDDQAEPAARAMLAHPGVDLAAWLSGEHELRVLSAEGEAHVCWSAEGRGLRLGYEPVVGDPLWLAEEVAELERRGRIDEQGFAAREDWLAVTADAPYPDAPARLVEGLTGRHVQNHATVLLSLRPGWGWGWKSAAVFAWFRGGALEGTHGGLDRESSLGFVMASEPGLWPGPVTRAERVLAGFGRQTHAAAQ